MDSNVRVVIANDPAAEAARELVAALEMHGPRLGISGGSALAVLACRDLAPWWPRLALTWVDERVVPAREASSNRGEAVRRAHVDQARLVVPLVRDDELDAPEEAIARVESALEQELEGALDVTLLGLGEDGHVASLFPGRAWDAGEARVMLVTSSPKPPPLRITCTLRFLATAHAHVVFAVGASKRDAIRRLRERDPALPASSLSGLVIITDADGAG